MQRSLVLAALPLALLAWAALAPAGRAAPAPGRQAPATVPAGTSCVSEGCHKDLVSRPAVHPPAAQKNGCGVCHEQQGDSHAFASPITGADLCYACHESVTKGKDVHGALKMGKQACTACHDPHSAAGKGLLKAEKPSDLCLQCHEDLAQGSRLHELGDMGGCTVCHQPHSSDNPKLLVAQQPALCGTCHGGIIGNMQKAASVHGPAAVACTTCHSPHQALSGKGLKVGAPDLCTGCHAQFQPTLDLMLKEHPEPLKARSCLLCHGPHTGAQKHLLKDTSEALCLACHKDDVAQPAGGTLPGLGPQLADGAHAHGPLAAHDCAPCHEPHANSEPRFLRGPYPAGIYADWTPDAYGFCFSCHDETLVTERKTTTATEFRNGDVNLHYVHVDRVRKGRTCRVCHESHASKNEHLLRTSLPFGQWELPIGFVAAPDGGTCTSGCHLPQTYSRGPAAAEAAAPGQ